MKKLLFLCLSCWGLAFAYADNWLIDCASHEGMIRDALEAKFGKVDIRLEEADGYSDDRLYVAVDDNAYNFCYNRDGEEWVLYQINSRMINVVYNYQDELEEKKVKTDEKGNKIVKMFRLGSGVNTEFEVSQEAVTNAVDALMRQREAIFALIEAEDEQSANVAAEKLAAYQAKMAALSKIEPDLKSQILMVWGARRFMLIEDLNTLLVNEIQRVKSKDCYGSKGLKEILTQKAVDLKGGFRTAEDYR